MKKLISVFILFLNNYGYSQDKILDVPLISQETNNWCWAAAMEMVIKYHQPSRQFTTESGSVPISQKYLAYFNYNNRERFIPMGSIVSALPSPELWSSVEGLTFTCSSTSSNHLERKLNIQIPTFGQANDQQAFDVLFSQLGFNSVQDAVTNDMWIKITNEIHNKCRPVIILLGNPLDNITTSSHAVVAMGYLQTPSNNFITVCNPKQECSSASASTCTCVGEYVLYTESQFLTSISSIVRFITPIGRECSKRCRTAPKASSLYNEFEALKLVAIKNDTLGADNVPLRSVSVTKLRDASNKSSESILLESQKLLKQKQGFSFVYEKLKDKLLLSEIKNNEAFKLEPKVKINNQEIQLSNKPGSKSPYDIILFPNSDYVFYRYQDNNQILLVPYRFYEIDEGKFEPNQSYSENSIISKLKAIYQSSIKP